MKRRTFLRGSALALAALAGELPADGGVMMAPDPVRDQLQRSLEPDRHYAGDVMLEEAELATLARLHRRLLQLQRLVGHGKFALLGFDQMVRHARNYPRVGPFAPEELGLFERLFHEDARRYGFFGEKPLDRLVATIDERSVLRPDGSSQYLFSGAAMTLYRQIRAELGEHVELTSGVRGVVKQALLFIHKVQEHAGNLSLASRSLAPPGYSFHGVGDFDVGVPGWGARNFTADFATTEQYRRLCERGHVAIRYPRDNRLGVRFEPWHIKVVLA